VITSEEPARLGRELSTRYTTADLGVLTRDEARRFAPDEGGDPRADLTLAWELLYRLEPEIYERMATAERLHPGIVDWLPRSADRIVEVGAGSGRLTMELINRGREVVAIEPAAGLRQILERKLAQAGHGSRARVEPGFFDDLPVPSGFADLVVACSVLTPAPGHGGDVGLAEMERVCRPGGCGRHHLAEQRQLARGPRLPVQELRWTDGGGVREPPARRVEMAEIFYPHAVSQVRRRGSRRVPYEVLGINAPA